MTKSAIEQTLHCVQLFRITQLSYTIVRHCPQIVKIVQENSTYAVGGIVQFIFILIGVEYLLLAIN